MSNQKFSQKFMALKKAMLDKENEAVSVKFDSAFLAKKAQFEAKIKAQQEAKAQQDNIKMGVMVVDSSKFSDDFLAKKAKFEAKMANKKPKKQHFCQNCGQQVFLRAREVSQGVYRGWYKVDFNGNYHICEAELNL